MINQAKYSTLGLPVMPRKKNDPRVKTLPPGLNPGTLAARRASLEKASHISVRILQAFRVVSVENLQKHGSNCSQSTQRLLEQVEYAPPSHGAAPDVKASPKKRFLFWLLLYLSWALNMI